MKNISSRQFIPILTALLGLVFIYVGIFHLGFWEHKPMPGFFPTIVATIMVIVSIIAFFQINAQEDKPQYNKDEISVIIGALAIIIGTFIIGLIPSVILYMLYWLKIVEKSPWKDIIIIMGIILFIVLGVFVGWLQINFPWGLFEMMM